MVNTFYKFQNWKSGKPLVVGFINHMISNSVIFKTLAAWLKNQKGE